MLAGRGARPGGLQGGMGGPVRKTKDSKVAIRRSAGRLKPESPKLIAALLLGSLSVTFTVIGPKLLGDAINVIFSGIIGSTSQVKELFVKCNNQAACVSKYLAAHGKSNFASMIAVVLWASMVKFKSSSTGSSPPK